MAELRLARRDAAKQRRDDGNQDVVGPVLAPLARGEGALRVQRRAGIAHFAAALADAQRVQVLVQAHVHGDHEEAGDAQVAGDLEGPGRGGGVGRRGVLREQVVDARGDGQDRHVGGQEVRFEEAVQQAEDAGPVRAGNRVGGDVGEHALAVGVGLGLFDEEGVGAAAGRG